MNNSISEEFLKYRKIIASLLHRIRPAATRQDIEDVLQDTFINTYKSSLTQEIKYPKSFMIKTAIRLANRQIQLSRRIDLAEHIEEFSDESLCVYETESFSSNTEREVFNRQDFGVLCEAVNELSPQCRRVFILKKIYGYSQRDIAARLNISESTVEKHVAKGLLNTMKFYQESQSQRESSMRTKTAEEKSAQNSTSYILRFEYNDSESKKPN